MRVCTSWVCPFKNHGTKSVHFKYSVLGLESAIVSFLCRQLDGMLVHRRVTPGIKFACTHFHARVEGDTVRVKCLGQEHNTVSPTRA